MCDICRESLGETSAEAGESHTEKKTKEKKEKNP